MKIIFATNNRHKLTEAQEILGSGYQLVTPCDLGITEDIPEEQPTLEGNAFQKARYLYDRTGLDCFADDTGLEVDALGGAPGVRSAVMQGMAEIRPTTWRCCSKTFRDRPTERPGSAR